MFIAGRAIAGTGLGGGYVGTMIIISMSAPLEKIPLYTSLIGARAHTWRSGRPRSVR